MGTTRKTTEAVRPSPGKSGTWKTAVWEVQRTGVFPRWSSGGWKPSPRNAQSSSAPTANESRSAAGRRKGRSPKSGRPAGGGANVRTVSGTEIRSGGRIARLTASRAASAKGDPPQRTAQGPRREGKEGSERTWKAVK